MSISLLDVWGVKTMSRWGAGDTAIRASGSIAGKLTLIPPILIIREILGGRIEWSGRERQF